MAPPTIPAELLGATAGAVLTAAATALRRLIKRHREASSNSEQASSDSQTPPWSTVRSVANTAVNRIADYADKGRDIPGSLEMKRLELEEKRLELEGKRLELAADLEAMRIARADPSRGTSVKYYRPGGARFGLNGGAPSPPALEQGALPDTASRPKLDSSRAEGPSDAP